MKKIKKLMDHIAEEINDAEEYILGQTGRWVAWLGSGSQPATGT